ncbi:Aste57867_778 [Aphanomyces stellatus]|uniref:Aste57867_778 protein n=1 Tax=Aphanomyces stellatus TaxID=120398 RepID=A0A485K7L1_9STRA|nr:hypothetical protein As57867_000777 [Aphanomyces stellatus]VFT78002.1 Aste57867_778 [Aphanomyces stellatus]
MMMDGVDARLEAERQRQRRHRESKRAKRKLIEAEIRYYEDQLERLHIARQESADSRRTSVALVSPEAVQVNASLREAVQRRHHFSRMLYLWVVSQHPQATPTPRPSWLHSTLLADPVGRRHGFEWLCQKVYHNARQGFPRNPFGNSVADEMRFTMHTTEDDDIDGSPTILAMEMQYQLTAFGHFKHVAELFWRYVEGTSYAASSVVPCQAVDVVRDRLVYYHGVHPQTGTSLRRIMCTFEEENRVVMVFPKIQQDESYPLVEGELRTHGFGWVVFERVTDSITLFRHADLHLVPVATHGPATTEQIGQLYGVSSQGESETRAVYIERIRSAAETKYLQEYDRWFRTFRQLVDE